MKTHYLKTPIKDEDLEGIEIGDIVYLEGYLITSRDDVHMRLVKQHRELPVDLAGKAIFHAGPIMVPCGEESASGYKVVSIGPTTSMRMEKFERELDAYFTGDTAMRNGLPTVKYFAERCFLSPNYFGDLIKKETGRTPQDYIQGRIIGLAKELLLGTTKTVNEISYQLGFQYSQHFNRYFKRSTNMTPMEYRKQENR